ncbi:MAG: hypothetical protein AB7W16_16990 [Candidatus Obscuribacterales bacterium]
MSASGLSPWSDDLGSDWFDHLLKVTDLRMKVYETLERDVDNEIDAIYARAAASIVLLLAWPMTWPIEFLKSDNRLASERLYDCIDLDLIPIESIKETVKKEAKILSIKSKERYLLKDIAPLMTDLWLTWLVGTSHGKARQGLS